VPSILRLSPTTFCLRAIPFYSRTLRRRAVCEADTPYHRRPFQVCASCAAYSPRKRTLAKSVHREGGEPCARYIQPYPCLIPRENARPEQMGRANSTWCYLVWRAVKRCREDACVSGQLRKCACRRAVFNFLGCGCDSPESSVYPAVCWNCLGWPAVCDAEDNIFKLIFLPQRVNAHRRRPLVGVRCQVVGFAIRQVPS
jgi:hypothetical protein